MKYLSCEAFAALPPDQQAAIPANERPITTAEFRRAVKNSFPHVTVTIRTVGFSDLARVSRKCLTVTNERRGELPLINQWAERAGLIPDKNIRCYEKNTGISLQTA